MRDALKQLRDAMPLLYEGGAAGDTVDWEAAAAELGVTSFPGDYREFVSIFGAGSIEESLYVWIPRPGSASAPLTVGRLPVNALRSESMNTWQESGASSRYRLEDVLVWGGRRTAPTPCAGWRQVPTRTHGPLRCGNVRAEVGGSTTAEWWHSSWDYCGVTSPNAQ